MMVLWISDQAKQMCHHCLWSLRDEKQQRQEKHEKIKTQFTWPLCLKKPNYTDLKEQWNKGRNVIPKWWTIRSRIYFKKWRTWTKWQPSGNNKHFRVCKQCPEGPEFTAHYSSLFYTHLEILLPILHLQSGFGKDHVWTYAAQLHCWIIRKKAYESPYHLYLFQYLKGKGWLQRR